MEHAFGTKTMRGLLGVFMTLAVVVLLTSCGGGDGTVTEISAPENVKATAGEGTVTITWDAVQGAASYHVYWSKTAGAAAGGTMIEVTGTSYVHEKLIYLQDYYYCVCAVNSKGEGSLSDEVTETPERLPIAHITFPDTNLDTYVNTYATNQGYTYADEITTLICGSSSISDITGVGWLTGLTYLYLDDNSISDISPISGLTSLTYLYLQNNSIIDISPVSGLTSLTGLYLGDNSITTGVATLTGLTSATTIDFTGNNNIPCADLTTLETALGAGIITHPASCIP